MLGKNPFGLWGQKELKLFICVKNKHGWGTGNMLQLVPESRGFHSCSFYKEVGPFSLTTNN